MKFNITFILIFSYIFASAQGIKFFEGDLASVKKEAQKENKFIFIDAYTTWCGPCKWLSKSIFTQKEVGDFFNKNFVCYSMDMEKGEGIDFRKKFNIRAFPTLLFIDSLGNMVHRQAGAMKENLLIELGKTALDPQNRLKELIERYKAGDREKDFIQKYLDKTGMAFIDNKECADWYFYTQSDKDLMSAKNIELIVLLVEDANNRCFKFIVDNQEECEKLIEEELDEYIENVFLQSIYKANRKGREDLQKAIADIRNSGYSRADKIIAKYELNKLRYAEKKDWGKITAKANEYFNKFAPKDWEYRNDLAWSYFENKDIQDKKLLKSALKWAKESVNIKEEYMNTDTYAALLYKLKMYKEAEKIALKAIKLAKESGDDASETVKLLEKIRKE